MARISTGPHATFRAWRHMVSPAIANLWPPIGLMACLMACLMAWNVGPRRARHRGSNREYGQVLASAAMVAAACRTCSHGGGGGQLTHLCQSLATSHFGATGCRPAGAALESQPAQCRRDDRNGSVNVRCARYTGPAAGLPTEPVPRTCTCAGEDTGSSAGTSNGRQGDFNWAGAKLVRALVTGHPLG